MELFSMIEQVDVPYPVIQEHERALIADAGFSSMNESTQTTDLSDEKATDAIIPKEIESTLRQDSMSNGLQATQDEFIRKIMEKMVWKQGY